MESVDLDFWFLIRQGAISTYPLLACSILVLGVVAREPVWVVVWFALAMGAVGAAEGPFWATAIAR